jgi:pyruvyl transferase EpsI
MNSLSSYKSAIISTLRKLPLLPTIVRNLRLLSSLIRKQQLLSQLKKYSNEPQILYYLMGHGRDFHNLGDQAQAAAIPIWLKKNFKGPIIQIKSYDILNHIDAIVRFIRKDDIVFIHSGGCFGDDWYETQQVREKILSSLSSYRIIQLPQTIHYSGTEDGARRLAISQNVIGNMKKFFLIGRDPESALLAREYFSTTKVSAYPDMVLSLQNIIADDIKEKTVTEADKNQHKCLLIIRNDKESVLNTNARQVLISQLQEGGYAVDLWDTDVDDKFPENEKLSVLIRYLKYISSYDVVVTDRYHGLIFAVLLKRPCVVLPTHNHKLTSAFDWFHKVNFVYLLADGMDVCEAVRTTLSVKSRLAPDWNTEYFDPMAKEIKSFLIDGN